MKTKLLATTALVLAAGSASAEISLSGSARMGIVNYYNLSEDDNVTQFSSRVRVVFTASGETDAGLSFGASVRHDQDDAPGDGFANGDNTVFISGAFGKLTMGDNDTAANALIGHVDGVGYTGNGDWNEIAYIGQTDTSVLYTYSMGDVSFGASVGQIDAEEDYDGNDEQAYSIAVAYSFGDYKVMAGYEWGQAKIYSFRNIQDAYFDDPEVTYWDRFDLDGHLVLGADATFGDLVVKARVGLADGLAYADFPVDGTQYALSATYTVDALAITAFAARSDVSYTWIDSEDYGFKTTRYGVGVAYDLGGGAAASVGYSRLDSKLTNYGAGFGEWSDDRFEAGLTFSF